MINIDTNAWHENVFEVEALTSGEALIKALLHLDAVRTERVLHSIHVGAAQDAPTTTKEMESWPKEDWFARLS
jgi:hypothetical protein